MDLLLLQPTIVDPSSPFHLKKADIFISNGRISSIGKQTEASQAVDCNGKFVSPGWIDLFAHFNDPGSEFKETIETGAAAAVAGGFTDVLLLPNTAPPVYTKSSVEYIRQRGKATMADLHPIGAITRNIDGKELSEMYDMHDSGAKAFSDGLKPIQSAGMLMKALQYIKSIDSIIIQLPDDQTVNPGGLMHEGIISTQLGLPGRPSISEELMISRDIELLKYTGSKIHFTGISTRGAVELIRKAKKEGLKVTCSVTPYHLTFSDNDLRTYDTNLKVNPPLRTAEDREALRNAVLDGTIDCIASHHAPHDTDCKLSEFEYAKNGMIGLQTAFAAVNTTLPQLSPENIVSLFSTNAARIFNIEKDPIIEGSRASLTIFDKDTSWQFSQRINRSRSANSAFFNLPLKGQAFGIINKGSLFLNSF